MAALSGLNGPQGGLPPAHKGYRVAPCLARAHLGGIGTWHRLAYPMRLFPGCPSRTPVYPNEALPNASLAAQAQLILGRPSVHAAAGNCRNQTNRSPIVASTTGTFLLQS